MRNADDHVAEGEVLGCPTQLVDGDSRGLVPKERTEVWRRSLRLIAQT